MEKHPEIIKFVKEHPKNETFEEFDEWLRKIEYAVADKEELEIAINECREHYGSSFGDIFDEDKLKLLHENYLDICQWELHESLKHD